MAASEGLPASIHLTIVAPDRALVDDQVQELQLPGAAGYLGVLPGHVPLTVRPGPILSPLSPLGVGRFMNDGSRRFVNDGFGPPFQCTTPAPIPPPRTHKGR